MSRGNQTSRTAFQAAGRKPRTKRSDKESPRMLQAFNYYCSLGAQRTYQAVAREFSKTNANIKLWAQKFNWTDRVIEYDANLLNAISEDTRTEVMKLKDEILSILRHMYKSIVEFGPDGKIIKVKLVKLKNIADLERLTKLFMLLEGEPTEFSREDHYVHDLRDVPDETLRAIAGNLPEESGVRTGSA